MAAPAPQQGYDQDEGRPQREVAYRIFAAEYNNSDLEVKEGGERSPAYLITPLGGRVNRLIAVGVLTQAEAVGTTGDMWRAQIMDPTGVFSVYAGQYQPEAATALKEIKPPAVVAVVGKSRVYSPEEGVTYTSIRPENVRVVDVKERDRWVLDAAKQTLKRLDAMREARKLEDPTIENIVGLGYPKDVAEGVARALAHYTDVDLEAYATHVRDALEFLVPGASTREEQGFRPAGLTSEPTANAGAAPSAPTGAAAPAPAPAETPAAPAAAPATEPEKKGDDEAEAREQLVLGLVESQDDGKGAPWEEIVASAGKQNVTEDQVEEALNALMDRGLIYEPVLGRLKRLEE